MISNILSYLKQKTLTATDMIDRLFVTLYVESNSLQIQNCEFIKSLLIRHDEEDFTMYKDLTNCVGDNVQITLEDLITLFECVVSPAERIVTGAVYTPPEIRMRIINDTLVNMESLTEARVADISCGCGGFLADVASYLHKATSKTFYNIYKENIWGIDIQKFAVDRTKILLSLLAISQGEDKNFEFNLLVADTLDYILPEWNPSYSDFDVIVGNPPYVCSRNLDKETKCKMLEYEVSLSGHPDLYIPFFQIATEMLKAGGVLGFITMNSFIRSINGRAVRKYFSRIKNDIWIEDFRGNQIFKGRNTYTCLFFLKKLEAGNLHYCVNDNGDVRLNPEYSLFSYDELDDESGWCINCFLETTQLENVGIPLAKFCESRHGIATLSNNIYIFRPISEDKNYYYLDRGDKCYQIEKGICRDIINSNKLNSDVTVKGILEKVIYPYVVCGNKAVVIDELTMKSKYPSAYKYLLVNQNVLFERDKGKATNYPVWYEYGRTQSLVMPRYKLFFPKFANRPLRCLIMDDEDLLLYNGHSFVSDDLSKLLILKLILESEIFWEYVVRNAKPYSSNYYSLSGVDIKKFGIPNFTDEEKKELLNKDTRRAANEWLRHFYLNAVQEEVFPSA